MTIKDLQTLYDYGYWANAKLFSVIEAMPPETFTQPVAGSYGSLRNTLVHMLSTEWGWLSRCGGPARPGRLHADDYPTLTSLTSTWRDVETYMRTFLASLTDADLDRIMTYPGSQGAERTIPLGQLLHHAANHGVHHRGQMALLIRLLGYTPGNIDILFYYAEQRGVSAW